MVPLSSPCDRMNIARADISVSLESRSRIISESDYS